MEYTLNRETGKIELIFSKEEYTALPEAQKSKIKSNFLFSRRIGGWVSRAKEPNTYFARRVADELGATYAGRTGETIDFAEQMAQKAERAENRAERMELHAENAAARAEQLQKPINEMHGDIAFFTQPNMNTSAGRSFTRRRDKMFAAYDRGFEEFKKSEYFRSCAESARATAAGTKPTDKGFCERRIKDAQKTIKAQRGNIAHYNAYLDKLAAGEKVTRFTGEAITAEEVREWIARAEDMVDAAISKEVYYRACLDDLGGIQYSRENIKKGYVVLLKRWGACEVLNTGTKNITYKILTGGAAGMGGYESYAEITRIISTGAERKEA